MGSVNGWPVISMPGTPWPSSIEASIVTSTGIAENPFNGSWQTQSWNAAGMEAQVTMPPMSQTDFGAWEQFIFSCNGVNSVFALPLWADLLPFGVGTPNQFEWWRLKTNSPQWSVNLGLVYGFSFTMRTALPTQWQATGSGTYQNWPIIAFPTTPPAQSLEITATSLVGVSESVFSGEMLTNEWAAIKVIEANCTMPPMDSTGAAPWIAFFIQASGTQCVFTLPTTFSQQNGLFGAGLVPINQTPSGYFRLKSNTVKWSISPGPLYSFSFKLRSAL